MDFTLHASSGRPNKTLCGLPSGRRTRPKEGVTCAECRSILTHVRDRYPNHASFTDWRLTAHEEKRAVEGMIADMRGGHDD